jgi:hypothetical protein
MDTAQRGMGLEWNASRELIRRSLDAASGRRGALIFCGAGTDHLPPSPRLIIDEVVGAYEEQIDAIERMGGRIVLMASRALAACARSPNDYVTVYNRILAQLREPCIIHWVGEMFDPALDGYFGHHDHVAADVCVGIIADNAARIDGIKLSLLDKDKELALRAPARGRAHVHWRRLQLRRVDRRGRRALQPRPAWHLRPDRAGGVRRAVGPDAGAHGRLSRDPGADTLSRHIFKAPTRFYKTGVVFMAYLNGHPDHFVMVGGQESTRSLLHLAELFRLADAAGLLRDPELAVTRMRKVLAVHGVEG